MNQRDKTASILKLESLQSQRLYVMDDAASVELELKISAQEKICADEANEIMAIRMRNSALRDEFGMK